MASEQKKLLPEQQVEAIKRLNSSNFTTGQTNVKTKTEAIFFKKERGICVKEPIVSVDVS